jgi:putative ABC transport system permease protein
MREGEYYEKQSAGTSMFITAMGVMIAVFFFSIGVMITMHASIANRQREIGTLWVLGFSRLSILTSFLIESVALALLGGAIGALASLAMGFVRFSTPQTPRALAGEELNHRGTEGAEVGGEFLV